MMRTTAATRRLAMLGMVTGCFLGSPPWRAAVPITVINASFELPDLPDNGAAVGAPTGWTGNGTVGYVDNGWNNGAINITNLDGEQAAWFNTDVGTSLSQVLTATFETGRPTS